MGYRLQREDGNLVRKFKVDGHNKAACDAELWWYGCHGDDQNYIVWYKSESDWHILIAGRGAVEQYGK